jgi:hypothetical protein
MMRGPDQAWPRVGPTNFLWPYSWVIPYDRTVTIHRDKEHLGCIFAQSIFSYAASIGRAFNLPRGGPGDADTD